MLSIGYSIPRKGGKGRGEEAGSASAEFERLRKKKKLQKTSDKLTKLLRNRKNMINLA